MLMRTLAKVHTLLSSSRFLISKKASSIAATGFPHPRHPPHPLIRLNGRHFATYRFECLLDWIEHNDGGKSLLATPPSPTSPPPMPTLPLATPLPHPMYPIYRHEGLFQDPRSRLNRSFAYTDLKYRGNERKEMLETAAIEWIGGGLKGLNTKGGRFEAYAIVGGRGTGKTRFLGEIVKQWDHWRDLSKAKAKANPTKASREIPPDTLVFPIDFSDKSPMSNSELNMIKHLLKANSLSKVDCKVGSSTSLYSPR
jgi:hypothetical protein